MTLSAHETVEFLDPVAVRLTGDDPARDADDAGRPPRLRWVLGAVLVASAVLVAARGLGAPPEPVAAAVTQGPVSAGPVALPKGFGLPVALVAPSGSGGDLVFVLGTGGQVARVVDGQVAAVSVGRGYRTVAARPDGRQVFVSTGRLAPAVVALDPVSLTPLTVVTAPAPVTALAAGAGSVWAASPAGLQGWTGDLAGPLPPLALPAAVTEVDALSVVGASLQARVTTGPGETALLGLTPPRGVEWLTPSFTGPVSVVPGFPPLLAHRTVAGTVEVVVDPAGPRTTTVDRPLLADASIWPATGIGRAVWAASSRAGPTIECYDAAGRLLGRMSVGDAGQGVEGPVVTTARAVYAVTVHGGVVRGSHGSCG